MSEEVTRSRVLVVGATGRLGGSLMRANDAAGHPTFALVRSHHLAFPNPAHLNPLAAAGATLLKVNCALSGALFVVSCAKTCVLPNQRAYVFRMVYESLEDYPSLLEVVQQEDVVICAVPTKHALEQKALIRAVKEAGCVKPGLDAPPRGEVKIFGEGNTKGVFVKEGDVAKFTVCTIEDPRTLNKTLYLRPPGMSTQ